MQSWTVRFIVYFRDGHYEVEGLNIGTAGVGSSVFEATDSFHKACLSLAAFAHKHGDQLTFEPDPEELTLYERLSSGKVDRSEAEELSVAAVGQFDLVLATVTDSEAHLGAGKLELVGGAA